MEKCSSADRYLGKQPPRCNGGDPCETCKAIYADAQVERRREVLKLTKEKHSAN